MQRVQHSSWHISPHSWSSRTPSCGNCGYESQNLFHLVLDCPALDSIRGYFRPFPFYSRPLVLSLGLPDYWKLRGVDPRPHSQKNGSGKPTTTTIIPLALDVLFFIRSFTKNINDSSFKINASTNYQSVKTMIIDMQK